MVRLRQFQTAIFICSLASLHLSQATGQWVSPGLFPPDEENGMRFFSFPEQHSLKIWPFKSNVNVMTLKLILKQING